MDEEMNVMGEFINIRGKNLYIEEFGRHHENTLLYLHGGPGASCLDFCFYQAKALSESVRVVAFDQRGVLRSDPIEPDQPFSIDDLIEDCEEIRKLLDIKEWTVLGHSFGGYLALKYAYKYPFYVKKLIFEAPSFNIGLSAKSIIQKAINQFEIENQKEYIFQSKRYLEDATSSKELWGSVGKIFKDFLGEKKDYLYLKSLTPDELNSIYEESGVSDELWQRTQIHTYKIEEEGKIFESLLPIISLVNQPSLLLHGKFDPIFCEKQKNIYIEKAPNSKIIVFENSAHFPRLEEPQKYTEEVINFILESSKAAAY
ncbi:alpha/beta hydrolase [Lederbergia sp. NSJ-179]|uniref:alpha/beta fold hydrolase n=1 Tax=Lederbergia sp. NSJ-179 TaxID=2931402 RepID=UPI001FD0DBDA|nr:alpha/beta hydrolase [Lederbergia sp. NSJ-179]MCJ7842794.1 alpha/beta hydrolase [Lederbergia sp. NSJ-179]